MFAKSWQCRHTFVFTQMLSYVAMAILEKCIVANWILLNFAVDYETFESNKANACAYDNMILVDIIESYMHTYKYIHTIDG